jgi:hypothetical protein
MICKAAKSFVNFIIGVVLVMSFTSIFLDARADDWTPQQKTIAAIGLTATVIDYGQTRYIASHPGLVEYSPLMGRHPSNGRIALNFIVLPAISYLIADNLSSEHRTVFLYAVTGIEIGMVGRNAYLGYGVKF